LYNKDYKKKVLLYLEYKSKELNSFNSFTYKTNFLQVQHLIYFFKTSKVCIDDWPGWPCSPFIL